jgi:hypothetical protein
MKTARTIGLGLGLIILVGVGAATFSRAQQSGREPAGQRHDNSLTAEALTRLEAEVALLQVEHEVARGDLVDFLKKCNRLELLQEVGSMTSMGLILEFQKEIIGKDSTEGQGQAIARASALAGEEETKKWESAASEDVKKAFSSLGAARDRKRKAFLEKTKTLNQKRRDLAEAEKHYQSEAR